MRKACSGHIISISSLAGLAGFEYNAAYCASKFGLEGFMESLHQDVAPYGIKTTIVEPGFFRTKFLEPESTFLAEPSIDDYAERNAQYQAFWKEKNGKQEGDPIKLAKALITIVNQEEPPSPWMLVQMQSLEQCRKLQIFKTRSMPIGTFQYPFLTRRHKLSVEVNIEFLGKKILIKMSPNLLWAFY